MTLDGLGLEVMEVLGPEEHGVLGSVSSDLEVLGSEL